MGDERAFEPTKYQIERAATLWAGDSFEAYDRFMVEWRNHPAMVRLVERCVTND